MKTTQLAYQEKVEMSFGLRTVLTLVIVAILISAIVAPVRSDHGRRMILRFSLPMIGLGLLLGLILGTFTTEEIELTNDRLVLRYGITRSFRLTHIRRAWGGEFHFSNTGGWGIRGLRGNSFVPRFGPAIYVEFDDGNRHKVYGFATEHPEELLALLGQAGITIAEQPDQ
jgi:hypothetical protein